MSHVLWELQLHEFHPAVSQGWLDVGLGPEIESEHSYGTLTFTAKLNTHSLPEVSLQLERYCLELC